METAARGVVHARIVYWGVAGAGASTSLQQIWRRLRPDHRGELERVPTRIDPTACWERLPIKLGEIAGMDTRFEVAAVPSGPEHAPTRKQLLDRADGLVFLADARPERLDADVEAFDELRRALAAYGRALEAIPLVIQLNHADAADARQVEELVRKLDAARAPVLHTVAHEGSGLLPVLSTISKQVVRSLRERPGQARLRVSPARPPSPAKPAVPSRPAAGPPPPAAAPAPVGPPPPTGAPAALDEPPRPEETLTRTLAPPQPWSDREGAGRGPDPGPADGADAALQALHADELTVPGPGPAEVAPPRLSEAGPARLAPDGSLELPLVLEDAAGRTVALRLRLAVELGPGDEDEGRPG